MEKSLSNPIDCPGMNLMAFPQNRVCLRGGVVVRVGEGKVVRVGAGGGGGQVRRWFWVNVSGEAS